MPEKQPPLTQQQIEGYVRIRGRIVSARVLAAWALGLVFVVLKLFGAITWPWVWVTVPCWGSVIYFIAAALGIAVFRAGAERRT